MKKILLILGLSAALFGITPNQIYETANRHCKSPATITAISCIESTYGKHKLGDHGTSFGVMQIKTGTARWASNLYPAQLGWIHKCSDKQLQNVLLKNDQLNIMIGSLVFNYRQEHYGYKTAVMSHNRVGNYKYYCKVEHILDKDKR